MRFLEISPGLNFALAAHPYLPLLGRCPPPNSPLEELTLCQYFALSVRKSFHLSSKNNPIYHVIILLYRPHFNFDLMITIVAAVTLRFFYSIKCQKHQND